MRSDVRLTVGPADTGRGVRILEMTEGAPLAWRRTPEAVYMVGTAACPVGSDDVTLWVRVLAGASLVLRSAAASVLWSGAGTRQAVRVTVEAGAELIWSPEPVIATSGCDHRQAVSVELHPTSRLHWREMIVLGRHGETAGKLESALRITLSGAPLLHHVIAVGARHPGWDGPAVLGTTKVLGQLVVAGPGMDATAAHAGTLGHGSPGAAVWSVSPLDGPGVLATVSATGVGVADVALAQAIRHLNIGLPVDAGRSI